MFSSQHLPFTEIHLLMDTHSYLFTPLHVPGGSHPLPLPFIPIPASPPAFSVRVSGTIMHPITQLAIRSGLKCLCSLIHVLPVCRYCQSALHSFFNLPMSFHLNSICLSSDPQHLLLGPSLLSSGFQYCCLSHWFHPPFFLIK